MSDDAAPLVLSVFSTFAVGGPQVRFVSLANHFGRAFRHLIFAMDGNYDCRAKLSPGLDLAIPSIVHRKGDAIGNLRSFRRFLRAARPDVLVTHNWGSIEWAMANRWKLARHVHVEDGFGPEEKSRQIPRRVIARRLLLGNSAVVLPSRTLLRIATETWRLDPRHLHYIPNGIDLARFDARRAPQPGQRGPLVVGTVAALRPEKNLSRLLRAFRAATEGRADLLVIAGDGPERPRLESLAGELGIAGRVRFAGHAPDPETLLRGFDVFALSSDTEQMPLSLLEAMASGLPVAATDVGDVRPMLAADNHPFVAPRDDAALAAALRSLLEDAGLRRRLGVGNAEKARREYDERTMFAAYGRLLGSTAPASRGEWREAREAGSIAAG